jgi:hypothetical protein
MDKNLMYKINVCRKVECILNNIALNDIILSLNIANSINKEHYFKFI